MIRDIQIHFLNQYSRYGAVRWGQGSARLYSRSDLNLCGKRKRIWELGQIIPLYILKKGKLKLLIIVGTRPEIIRLAAVINKCRRYFDVVLAHTGQNYDYNLNGIFFENLKIGNPEVYMDAVGDDLGATVGNIISCSYKLMTQIRPDALLILGDTQLLPVSHRGKTSAYPDFSYGSRKPV